MEAVVKNINERYAAKAFSAQSGIFDEIYAANTIVNYKRDRVRAHVLHYLKPNATILELNSGTGEDAAFFASLGHRVHATDIAKGMQKKLREKAAKHGLNNLISTELRSFTELAQLKNKGPFDCVFSNFAGLNCTGELNRVLLSLPPLLNDGGIATLVILPRFCLWESLLLFKGMFKTATRRWFSKNGVKAHIEGTYFTCWYYNPSDVINTLKDSFDVLSVEGLCTVVPPSYIEHFAEKYPAAYRRLKKIEERVRFSWPWRFIGDYYIISLRKK
ncbi:bifunctional 2-polyprenyl-6-hydroxyphenol methylase/3-demethylubiquinol 3-O-methyltransferase UbiG [Mucilaginibacter sp. UR6-11]|uniref:class I SAM-dependent methyltransferase n=1 Tax=Mucilaginibacter sp. UR6-11 TaxID=1435644 RepID=UPI001E3D878A|nr:class I SAM-dependent methyltransferase [Mucilaginibacter sp. UR6-11]MCC8427183.1 class I SAM-dependent methyltransferase [Mucilaginibacter sp. UR6-11]